MYMKKINQPLFYITEPQQSPTAALTYSTRQQHSSKARAYHSPQALIAHLPHSRTHSYTARALANGTPLQHAPTSRLQYSSLAALASSTHLHTLLQHAPPLHYSTRLQPSSAMHSLKSLI